MEHENLFNKLLAISDELDKIEREHSLESSRELHPRALQLLAEAKDIINELDPALKLVLRDRPEQLDQWELLQPLFESIEEDMLNVQTGEPAPSTQDELADPHAEKRIREADALLREIDPMARDAYEDHPDLLAEWERHMEKYYNFDKEGPEESDS